MVKEGYKQSEIGIIPMDWNLATIKEAFEIKNYLRLPISKKNRETMVGPYPYYGPTGVLSHINEFRIKGKHALIGEDGDHFLKWREMPMTLLVNGKFNVNNHAHIISGINNLTEWFFWFFNQRDITLHLTRQGAGRYKLTKKSLEEIPCVLPPIEEQKTITDVLSDVDGLIEALDRLIAKKRAIKTGTMQQLLTGKKRLPGFGEGKGYKQTEIGEIPEDWELSTLNEVGKAFVNGGTPSTKIPEFWTGVIPWITGADIINQEVGEIRRSISRAAVLNSSTNVIEKGCLLIVTRTGVGKLAIAPFNLAISQDLTGVVLDISIASTIYVFHFLNHNANSLKLLNQGTSISGITRETLLELPILLPSLTEQKAITEILSDMDNEIMKIEKRREKMQILKIGLMQELLTGRTRLV